VQTATPTIAAAAAAPAVRRRRKSAALAACDPATPVAPPAETPTDNLDDDNDLDDDEALALGDDVDDDREPCDFTALVSDLPLSNVDGCLELIEVERAPFMRLLAADETNRKRNIGAEFYNVVNGPLFTRRMALQAQLSSLAGLAEADKAPLHNLSVHRATCALESLTEIVVRFNYGMTRKYVRRFTSNTSREDSEDFQGAAILGLMNSINTFDPGKGRFGSWAYKRIQREVLRAVRDADFANMNHGDFERRPDVLRAYAKLAAAGEGHAPTYAQVAAEAGVTVELVTRVLSAPHLDSLHAHIGADGDTELGDLIPDRGPSIDSQVIGAMDVASLIEHGLGALDSREHYVLARRFGLDGEPAQCLSSIGTQLRLSREAIRQIEAKALAKILHPVTLRKLVRQGRA